MSLSQIIADFFRNAFGRKKRDDQWAARFDQQPSKPAGKLPLDPGKSELS
jgi:hypothetical protein